MPKQDKNTNPARKAVFEPQIVEHLNNCIDRAIQEHIEVAKIGNEPVFVLCQYFKGVVKDDTPVDSLESFLQNWYKKYIAIQNEYEYEEVFLLFADIWKNKRAKHAKTANFEIAVQRAEKQTGVRSEIAWCDKPHIIKLDNICYELQILQGTKPFFISQYQAGKIIGKSPVMGRYALDYLTGKTIEKVTTGDPLKRLANSYHYIGVANYGPET